jgi:predicted secreted Zn-dependent protease
MGGIAAGMQWASGMRLVVWWLALGLPLALMAACTEATTGANMALTPVDPVELAAETTETPVVEETPTAAPARRTPTATRIPTATPRPADQAAAPPPPTPSDLPIPPGFTEETIFVYYTITGSTAAELRAQMERLGPGGAGASHYDAASEWHFNWAHRSRPGPYGCAIDSVGVRATITMTMPKWDPPPDASPALRERWHVFLAALLVHEEGHRQIAISHGQQMVQALQALPPAPTCAALKAAVDATAKQILDRASRADAEYDRRTRHGLEQGTKFP